MTRLVQILVYAAPARIAVPTRLAAVAGGHGHITALGPTELNRLFPFIGGVDMKLTGGKIVDRNRRSAIPQPLGNTQCSILAGLFDLRNPLFNRCFRDKQNFLALRIEHQETATVFIGWPRHSELVNTVDLRATPIEIHIQASVG